MQKEKKEKFIELAVSQFQNLCYYRIINHLGYDLKAGTYEQKIESFTNPDFLNFFYNVNFVFILCDELVQFQYFTYKCGVLQNDILYCCSYYNYDSNIDIQKNAQNLIILFLKSSKIY